MVDRLPPALAMMPWPLYPQLSTIPGGARSQVRAMIWGVLVLAGLEHPVWLAALPDLIPERADPRQRARRVRAEQIKGKVRV